MKQHDATRRRRFGHRQHEVRQRDLGSAYVMRPDQVPPNTPEAAKIEAMKEAGLVEVRPEDIDKPWADQRLRKTPLGELHEARLRREHPEWFPS